MLDQLPRDTSRERNGTRFTFYEWDETTLRPVFIQPAPSVSVFTVPVPDTPQRVVFFSAVFVADAPEDYGGPPPDGIIFRVAVRGPDGETRVLTEGVYDPTETDELVRTLLPLNDFRGQTVELILQ